MPGPTRGRRVGATTVPAGAPAPATKSVVVEDLRAPVPTLDPPASEGELQIAADAISGGLEAPTLEHAVAILRERAQEPIQRATKEMVDEVAEELRSGEAAAAHAVAQMSSPRAPTAVVAQDAEISFLPTEKTSGKIDPLRKKILIHGQPKIGKSTLVAGLDPERTLFLATEPGLDALEVFRVPGDITSWQKFRQVCAQLAADAETGKPRFDIIVIDTVDALHQLCVDAVIDGLSGHAKGFFHASDFSYGKGWDAITSEFKLRVAKLCNLGYGVVFVSHTKEMNITLPNGVEVVKLSPDIGQKGSRKWLLGFVDFIFMADIIHRGEEDLRVLRTQPTSTVEAGGRVPQGKEPLPAMIPLEASELLAALAHIAA